MDTFYGIGATKKTAVGTIYVLEEQTDNIKGTVLSQEEEIGKLRAAIHLSSTQISDMTQNLDDDSKTIIEVQQEFLEDPSFSEDAIKLICQDGLGAAQAIRQITADLCHTMGCIEDNPYLKERAIDIQDVGDRIVRNILRTKHSSLSEIQTNTVIVAKDFLPSQIAQINRDHVKGLVTEAGSFSSHTAIMARAMGIAAVVGCKGALEHSHNGSMIVVDGINECIIVAPDDSVIKQYQQIECKQTQDINKEASEHTPKLQRSGGSRVLVTANIGMPEEAQQAKNLGADGIGLFRTEFLYMSRERMPNEDEQFEAYSKVLQIFQPDPVVIRTLDIGGDKTLPYLPLPQEDNPYLGVRAIRLCLKHRDIFKTQLRALLRASIVGNLKIMFPMISGLDELLAAKAILDECKKELEQECIRHSENVQVGMMIEIPAAAVMADQFAEHVDFFSIGTNDLTQYSLAVDRNNIELSTLYNSMHPGVIWLIEHAIQSAHNHGIPCYMCGELAGDNAAAPLLAKFGLDEYSVSPYSIKEAKSVLLQQDCISVVSET